MEEKITMLISYFNSVCGTRYRTGNEGTRKAVKNCIEVAGGDTRAVREYFKTYSGKTKPSERNINNACEEYLSEKAAEAKAQEAAEKEVAEKAAAEAKTAQQTVDGAFDLLGKVVVEMLAKTKLDEVEEEVAKRLENRVEQFILDNYGKLERKVEFQLGEKKFTPKGVVHGRFEQVLKFVQAGEPVFLTGPAGSGKNVLCQQVAEALGLNFYFTNAVTQEYKLTGFTDAMGVFHESQFYKAFKNGGVFMLDEMDASIPEVLIILNAAIANRYFDFPAPIGYVEAHEDFRVIAAGNTFGIGADYDYVGRNQLDAASLDRFALVKVDYDERIESACAAGNNELLSFCRKFRSATKKAGIRTVVSYRAISRMAKLDSVMGAKELLESCLIKSLDGGDLDAIRKELNGCGKYSSAFMQIADERKEG